MAIYHLSVKVISRAAGRSAVAAAAYRSASRLHDERLGRTHDFTNKSGVVHSEVLLPEDARREWADREQLWNHIEAIEKRKDAQLAREIEFAIPREMNQAQGIALARDFVGREFVDAGMIADLNVHWDIGADGLAKPHAHVMLTMREIVVGEDGKAAFGQKVRDWNRAELVEQWRERWADHVNERLAALDIDARIDHRSLEAQGIDLEPQNKIGAAASRMAEQGLEVDRADEHLEIARSNGIKLLANPSLAFDTITHSQATFTNRDLAMFVHRHSAGTIQYDAVLSAVKASPHLIALGKDGRGDPQQLQAIEAGAAFRSIHEHHGGIEITEVRRQHEGWQQDATRELATGRTADAIRAYDEAGTVHVAETRDGARGNLIERWDRDRQANPDASRIILTHTNAEVREFNDAARERMRDAGDLGADVQLKVERGDRSFAPGDRIMFLRNERSLEVKNGTLGTIERVSEQRMAVRTDDGRSVAFDTKDYRDLDHGYAATVHKAQGMTVDRTHVLATPGMDRHGAYVALSRHRDGVALHYGRDDFKDQGKLVRALSRDRPKDMAQDYGKADPARSFAEQRGITFGERVAEMVKAVPQKARGIFDNFRPKVEPQRDRGMVTNFRRPERQPGRLAPSHDSDRQRAVERYARAAADIARMQAKELPVLAHQRAALDKAGAALDVIRPHASADLQSAFDRQPELIRQAAAGNSQTAMHAMEHEAKVRIDPAARADRFVEDWQRLRQQRDAHSRDPRIARAVSSQMGAMAKGLERDAQVESLLRNRKASLGIEVEPRRSIGQSLADIAGFGRGRSRGIGIGM